MPPPRAAAACGLLVAAVVASCAGGARKGPLFASRLLSEGRRPAEGSLTIAWALSEPSGVEPSYQTAIWLEDLEGNYLLPLFVSDYLAYCGASHRGICPDWVRVARWEETPKAEFDAVTRATPPTAPGRLTVDCARFSIPPGTYRYCVETHIVGEYNVLYKGTIEVGGRETSSTAEATYSPAVHPKAGGVLEKVTATYRPNGA